jgi:CRISPR/Cas system CSM-associated protein Csm2 small subunit
MANNNKYQGNFQNRGGNVQNRDGNFPKRDGNVQNRDGNIQNRDGNVQNRDGNVQNGDGNSSDPVLEKFNKENFSINALTHNSIEAIKNFMSGYVGHITSSQLRNVYSIILDKKLGNPSKRVKLSYIAAKIASSKGDKVGMRTLLTKLDDMLSENVAYEIIRNFAEACVAYHKYFETFKKNKK